MADFSEEWLSKEDLEEKPVETAKPAQRGRRGENSSQTNAPPKKQEEERKVVAKGIDTSNWLQGTQDDDEPQRPTQVARGKACNQEMSFLLKGAGQELVPDKLDTSWGVSQQKTQKSKQPQQSKQSSKDRSSSNEAPRRGNRGQQPANFKKKPTYVEQTESKPRGTYNNGNNYNGYNNNYNRDSNYRGRGRGNNRGGNRGYQQRDGQYESSGRNYGGGGNNYYKKRDNVAYQEKNQQQEVQKRGNRQYNNNNRDYRENNNRDYRENNNRQYNNYERRENNYNNRGNNRDHYKEANRDREQYDDRSENNKHYSQKNQQDAVSTVSKVETKVIIVEKEKEKTEQIPKGRRCWPESSIYILGCKFSICYRPITEYRCKLLVIPYATLKLEYYPGNIINSSEVDYKARILAKGEQISSPGSVYLQKAVSVGTFTGIAFLKVDEKRISDSLKLGIKNLLNTVQRLEGSTVLQSILFPICEQLSNIQTVISTFLQNLQNYKRIKEVHIATNQSQCFMKAMNIFVDEVQEMLEDNQILMT